MAEKNFRKDINGLRAIAVLSVLVFHFSPSFLPGGFAGVDVFFVISGFLMTSIIFRGVENNNFSVVKFLIARCKRIVPALVAVVVVLLIVGYLIFEPLTYQVIGNHSFSSLLFISNFTYFFESGYFDADSRSKFLLHTWSLSVEWQFYIIYPIIVYALSKILSLSKIKIAVVVAAVVSLSLSVYVSYTDPSAAYFMLYTRAWEMMVGGLAFLYPLARYKEHSGKIEIAGIALIAASIALISDKTPWPGYAALLPVVGAYFVILANNENSILSNIILQKAGLWSYSIYLVHWPVIVTLGKFNIDVGFLTYLYIVLAISIILYYTVEKRRSYGLGLCCMFVIALYASYYVSEDGIKSRVDEKFGLSAKEFHAKYYGGSGTPQGNGIQLFNINNNEPEFIITGDSFARQYSTFLKEYGKPFAAVFQDGCISTNNYVRFFTDKIAKACTDRSKYFNESLIKYKSKYVLYAQIWSSDWKFKNLSTGEEVVDDNANIVINELTDIVNSEAFRSTNDRKLFVIGKTQGTEYLVFECLAKNPLPINTILKLECPAREEKREIIENKILEEWASKTKGVYFINPNDALCDAKNCIVQSPEGEPIYSDKIHLTKYGSEIVGKYIFNKISEVMSK
ncbi:acyltransferase family protein [Citrobacter telavivensis]|uniref:acyltransferase family protein n=1 Tax=Citrobacter telavivensis TaxID=2653932 RepID=UPI00359F02AA